MVKSDTPFWLAVKLSVCTLAALLLVSSVALAQDSAIPLEMRTKAEFLDKQERISGGAAVGVAFYDSKDSVNLDDLYAYFSEPVDTLLEMQLVSVDGRYVATFDYVPKEPISGWRPITLSLSNPDFLTDYGLNEVALLLTNADSGTAYPVRWGTGSETDVVRVYVNTEGAKSYFVMWEPDPSDPKKKKGRWKTRSCTMASTRSSFKFDRICDVPYADVLANNEIVIMRKRGADFGTPLTVKVLLTKPGDP